MPKRPEQGRTRTGKVAPKTPAKASAAAKDTLAPPAAVSMAKLIAQIITTSRANAAAQIITKPLPAGTVGPEIPVNLQALQQLITAAATDDDQKAAQVWTKGSSELIVVTGKVAITLDDGLVLITIPVSCDQLASGIVQVPFAAGGKETPAGMVFATEDRPRGPELIVDVWGESLTAFAWKLLLTVTHRLSLQSGVDEDGAGLVPIAFTAAKDGISVLPIARHTFDRVKL